MNESVRFLLNLSHTYEYTCFLDNHSKCRDQFTQTIDWLYEFHNRLMNKREQTFHRAVSLGNRFMKLCTRPLNVDLYTVYLTCYNISSDFLDIYLLKESYIYDELTHRQGLSKHIVYSNFHRTKNLILKTLKYNGLIPSPYDYLIVFNQLFNLKTLVDITRMYPLISVYSPYRIAKYVYYSGKYPENIARSYDCHLHDTVNEVLNKQKAIELQEDLIQLINGVSDMEFEICSENKETYIEPESYPISPSTFRESHKYEPEYKIGHGAYGAVYSIQNTNLVFKKVEKCGIDPVREISILANVDHENIVKLEEYSEHDNFMYLVMKRANFDLLKLRDTNPTEPMIKNYLKQILTGLKYLHDRHIVHRDMKPENVLVYPTLDYDPEAKIYKETLKICDFGHARNVFESNHRYTSEVCTLWYRSIDLLLGRDSYGRELDMWSIGCIFGELVCGKPLFTGGTEQEQLLSIMKTLGTPVEPELTMLSKFPRDKRYLFFPRKNIDHVIGNKLSSLGLDLLNRMLEYCPSKRITVDQALNHEYFTD